MSESNNTTTAESNNSNKLLRHWPSVFLGLAVIVVFCLILFTQQIRSTEFAIVTTFGEISQVYGYKDGKIVDEGGLKLRWPVPIQRVYTFDNRIRPFIGKEGRLEETLTKDEKNIIVGVSMNYQIIDPEKFYVSYKTIDKGESAINSYLRSKRGEVINQYNFSDLINIDPKKMKTSEICVKIEELMNKYFEEYGVKVSSVGISALNIPQNTTKDVFARMKADRKRVASISLNRGRNESQRIKDDALNYKKIVVARAKAEALKIRAEGDAKAATYYKVFNKEPKLAAFLRKLEALRNVTKSKTTLILDTNSAPFDILNYDSFNDVKKTDNK